ncbi:hypothetical protein CALCODRAFT_492037 [Calocera cornea HHB12733]|uniref:Uncharacterized protein n=1 Tax=Calocera cornea HHB12733 TaxID=1353952 RepID=A0A165IMR4_9BASI|nr:hypothetical protein CALCODRAFT_492037 [Calocera cornea HHB12733]
MFGKWCGLCRLVGGWSLVLHATRLYMPLLRRIVFRRRSAFGGFRRQPRTLHIPNLDMVCLKPHHPVVRHRRKRRTVNLENYRHAYDAHAERRL